MKKSTDSSLLKKYNKLRKAHETLIQQYKQLRQQCVVWSWEDFVAMNNNREKPLKLPQWKAQWLCEKMIARHDASIGITWESITCYLDSYEMGFYDDVFSGIIERKEQGLFKPMDLPTGYEW